MGHEGLKSQFVGKASRRHVPFAQSHVEYREHGVLTEIVYI